MTGGIIEITIPYELWNNTNTDPIQLPKGTYKALIENPSKVLYIHVVESKTTDVDYTGREYILNTLEAIRVLESDTDNTYILINFQTIANEFAINPDDTINFYKASSGETWVLNETLALSTHTFTVVFSSNEQKFNTIKITGTQLFYDSIYVYAKNSTENIHWINEAYRTITFEEAVTDSELLAWLEANGVKQA